MDLFARPQTTGWTPHRPTDATPGDGFGAPLDTSPLADGSYDLRAVATDGGGGAASLARSLGDGVAACFEAPLCPRGAATLAGFQAPKQLL